MCLQFNLVLANVYVTLTLASTKSHRLCLMLKSALSMNRENSCQAYRASSVQMKILK